jgi:hypothetical protein
VRHVLIRYGVFQQFQTAPPDTSLLQELPARVLIFQPRHVLQLLNASAQLQHAQLRYVTSQPEHEPQLQHVISLLQHEPQLRVSAFLTQHEPQLRVSTFLTQHELLLLLAFTFQLLLQLLYEDVLAQLRDDVFSLPWLLSPI